MFSLFYVKQSELFFKNETSSLKSKPFTVSFFVELVAFFEFTPIAILYLSIRFNHVFDGFTIENAIPIMYTTFTSIIVKVLITWCNRNSSPAVVGCSYSLQVFLNLYFIFIGYNWILFIICYEYRSFYSLSNNCNIWSNIWCFNFYNWSYYL